MTHAPCRSDCQSLITCLAHSEDLVVNICSFCKRVPFGVTQYRQLTDRRASNIKENLESRSYLIRSEAELALNYCSRATWYVWGYNQGCPGCAINERAKKEVARKPTRGPHRNGIPCNKTKTLSKF
jgi:hypothetical protein